MKDFPTQLRTLVDAAGGPTKAAKICGVSRETLHVWLRGHVPSELKQRGALAMLREATGQPAPGGV